ncbi:geminin [Tribolium castaneum]|uniref:Geminin-like Protein n=1 Tax=Tribolium castaneum TaxID=7070 RepID=D6WVV0_TRICA|nr:PREDICTED: geminin [Tribolium castaneum]EFA08619.1 Geminin-like Protein [Tribolium castaneum]|eukprot:XP_970397.1 PREDICTED: geminin [Tribolium castaneum]
MKTGIKIDSQEQKENVKNTRKTLKVLQQAATNKENLAGRILGDKEKTSFVRHKILEDKAVQTGESTITAEDLTSEEPSPDYWKRLAEKREQLLNESFEENERLRQAVEALQEENKICKDMLDESRHLVEVLQEMLCDGDADTTEVAEEATEETN